MDTAFSSVFTQRTIANSAYNALQASLGKAFFAWTAIPGFLLTYGKSIDFASTFENIVVLPINPKRSRALSLFDSRHRFVLSYVWEIPLPKFEGLRGKILTAG